MLIPWTGGDIDLHFFHSSKMDTAPKKTRHGFPQKIIWLMLEPTPVTKYAQVKMGSNLPQFSG